MNNAESKRENVLKDKSYAFAIAIAIVSTVEILMKEKKNL